MDRHAQSLQLRSRPLSDEHARLRRPDKNRVAEHHVVGPQDVQYARVAERAAMPYDSAAHEFTRLAPRRPGRRPRRHPSPLPGLPGAGARRPCRIRGLPDPRLPGRERERGPGLPEGQRTANIAKVKPAGRACHVALRGVSSVAASRERLSPRVALQRGDRAWPVAIEQPSFDGKPHLWLALQGDTRETVPAVSGGVVTIRRPAGGVVRWSVRVTTDAAALTSLTRKEIFNDDFQRFYDRVRADTTHPLRSRRLEREVRGAELLSYREKMMAGLPNFATYFGRDMLMTALLMQPVWAPAMPEHVIASALEKLAPDGDVSHEEALGGPAIRANAAEYNPLVAAGRLARARAVLHDLPATRGNYIMVDDDFQLPVVAPRYLADARVPADRKRAFLREGHRLEPLLAHPALGARRTAP